MARAKAKRQSKPQVKRLAKSAQRAKPSAGRTSSQRAAPKAKAPARRPVKQRFIASHLKDSVFEQGLRSYSAYRDLGVAAATQGLAQAHVIRMILPCDPAVVSKEHYHDVEFQLIYVLKGWFKGEYAGAGVITMEEGSCWIQPPRIKHTVLDYSDDCELLEIILPAEFDTVET
jgi:quercetin dioxygenase-like cupin family protein